MNAVPTTGIGLLACLYMLEASGLLAAMALYKSGEKSLAALLTGRYSPFFLAGVLGVLGFTVYLVIRYQGTRTGQRRQFWLPVAMNIATVALAFTSGEAIVRLLASPTPAGPTFLNTLLLPRSWSAVLAHNRDLLQRAPSNISYFVPDDLLGWTVGPNRRSNDGLYFSSSEGIRSGGPNVSYAAGPAVHRVATVGDSFTFGLEVPFEASWPNRLEQLLGPQTQILNFGVDAYGVDQAYLRYSRDVRPWHPDLVVLGFIQHDLHRSLVVYHFVSFREGFPFAKPRLVVAERTVRPMNVPLPSPEEILSTHAITDLPFIEYDPGYDPIEWTWHEYYHSHLVRFVLSRFRRWPEQNADTSIQAVTLNGEIIASFARLAEREGSIPLVVYFPARSDFLGIDRSVKNGVLTMLRGRGIRYEDLTSCLSELSVSELFIEGRPHYSPKGNAKAATCLQPVVRDHLVNRGRHS
jgi:hypothetical protein